MIVGRRILVVAACAAGSLVGAIPTSGTWASRAIADTKPSTLYYCIDGTYPSAWGVSPSPAPQPGEECYTSLDALDAAKNLPSQEFWNSLPTNVNTNVPRGGSFDPVKGSLGLPGDYALAPGEVIWGRCNNHLILSQSGPRPTGNAVWWAPPPGLSTWQAQLFSMRVARVFRLGVAS